ncbi:gliding motility-associated C-terminal domain-containing protein [Pontibacter liquoris]|uniref:gliding motility-associated C-terminal domain-containing protein n=1 Tax=Pontibacter liquoris TaxID=2905677 RepID=UPI001FA6C51B|nr:gliding motility-associated C-terminal domain-containing protein [Pontibacter liquoris]
MSPLNINGFLYKLLFTWLLLAISYQCAWAQCTMPTAPVIQTEGTTNTICTGGSLILKVVDPAPRPGLKYTWSNGTTGVDRINVTKAGKYSVIVTDENGCTGTSNIIEVTQSKTLKRPTIEASGPTSVCEVGSVTLSVPAITGASYEWKKDGVTFAKGVNSIVVTEPGEYTILETNPCGPVYSRNKVDFIIDHPVPSFSVIADGPLQFCPGDSVMLYAPDVPNATYVWKKDGVAFGDSLQEQAIKEAGTYTVELVNTCGVFVSNNKLTAAILPAPVPPKTTGGGGCKDSPITLKASGGTNGMYRWYTSEFGGTPIKGAVNDTFVTPPLRESYTYYVAISNGSCDSFRTPVEAKVEEIPPQPAITYTGALSVCNGEVVRLAGQKIAGAIYQWKKDGKIIPNAQDSVYYAAESGTYSLEFSNLCGARASSKPVTVEIRKVVTPPTVQNDGSCEPASLTLLAFGGDVNGYRWYENPVSADPIPNATGATFVTPRLEKSHTYYVSVVKDGCESERVPVEAIITTPPKANAGKTVVIEQGKGAELQGSGGVQYHWEPATGLSNPNIANPIASPQETITYHLTVTNEAGCQDTASVVVLVEKALKIPNAFSPNGDGVNDTWHVGGITEFPGVKLEVFTRWGNKIFESDSYQNEWDGTYRGSRLPENTYMYIFTLPSKRQITGYVNLVQ